MKKEGLREVVAGVPLVGYLFRYWYLVAAVWLAALLLRWEPALEALGVFVHLPLLVALVAVLSLLARHLVNRDTSDRYRASGRMREEWQALTPFQRVLLFKLELWVWFLVLAILGHSMLG